MTEERILDFLDGNLGTSEEEELLHRLAVSPERRNLLKQHLQMRELTASLARRQYVTVPKMVTASLFTTLAANGYAGPKMPAADSKESLVASLEKNLSKSAENIAAVNSPAVFHRSSLILASMAAFIFGAALIYFLMPEARQEKFASSVSTILQGQSSAVEPMKAQNMPNPIRLPAIINSDRNIGSSVAKDNLHGTRMNLLSDNGSEINNSPSTAVGDLNIGANPLTLSNDTRRESIETVDSKYPPVTQAFIGGSGITAKNPFDHLNPESDIERTFWQRISFSFRSGEGKAPGNEQALTGSLIELKASYDIIPDVFVAKISVGQFMPYEIQAVAAGFNADGFRLLQLKSVLQYRAILGAELGVKFNIVSAPFELTGGFISDLQGNIIPRFGFFTSLALQDNLSMNLGLEGMIYSHDISSSLRNAQSTYAADHPSLIGVVQNKESTGFIGPAVELMWHF